jgi:hypothetical protein
MAAPNVRNVIRVPGRLVKDPTNLQAAYPHGGTELGIARTMEYRPGIETQELIAEEWKRPIGVVVTMERPVMAGVLRTWDNSMMAALFHNTQTDAFGEVGIVGSSQGAGINRAGYDLKEKGIVLFFSPHAVDDHRCIIFYNAVPVIEESARIGLSIKEEFGIPFFFTAMPDRQGRDHKVDLRANLTL